MKGHFGSEDDLPGPGHGNNQYRQSSIRKDSGWTIGSSSVTSSNISYMSGGLSLLTYLVSSALLQFKQFRGHVINAMNQFKFRFQKLPHKKAHLVGLSFAAVLLVGVFILVLSYTRGAGLRIHWSSARANESSSSSSLSSSSSSSSSAENHIWQLKISWHGFATGTSGDRITRQKGTTSQAEILSFKYWKDKPVHTFGIITDQDKLSKRPKTSMKPKRWVSYFRRGRLVFSGKPPPSPPALLPIRGRLHDRMRIQNESDEFAPIADIIAHNTAVDSVTASASRSLLSIPLSGDSNINVGKPVPSPPFYLYLEWIDPLPGIELWSRVNEDGRGMELSELIYFNNQLLSPDDRTGVLYQILSHGAKRTDKFDDDNSNGLTDFPRVAAKAVLADGPGDTAKGFKGEWMVIKDGDLIIGGHGKEFTNPYNGTDIKNTNPMWIKKLDAFGALSHIDWSYQYNRLRQAVGAEYPGYLIHEAVLWSAIRRQWIFLPRRFSTIAYSDDTNEHLGWNVAIFTDERFESISSHEIKLPRIGERGFSTAKFVPGSEEILVMAIRTVELEGINQLESYLSVFNIEDGDVYMEETFIGDYKFEGLEFFPI